MSRVSRQIAFLSDNIDIAVEYILLNRYVGGQSTEYSHAGLSGPVGALPGFANIKLKLFCFITIVLFKRLCPGEDQWTEGRHPLHGNPRGETNMTRIAVIRDPCRQRLRGVVPGCAPDRPRVNKQREVRKLSAYLSFTKGVGMINSLFSTAMAFPPTASDEASSGQAL